MFTINDNYLKLQGSYLFSNIAKKVAAFQERNPGTEIIRLGITPSGLQNHGPHRDPGVPGCHSEVQAFRERKALLADRAG